jgi:chromosome segregation ATPase
MADDTARLKKRLAELKIEYDSGQKQLAALQHREIELKATLERIKGAIDVLEEMIGDKSAS